MDEDRGKTQNSVRETNSLPTPSAFEVNSNDVFISYSRKDQQFVRTLDAAFRAINRNPWVDWDDIQKGEEWWKAIQRGIEAAHTFVFVLSPDSVASNVCRDEIEHAARCNKRFLPIVRREGFEMPQVHSSISSHNWLFFRETDAFDAAFEQLLKAIDTDLDHVRTHTRLLVRALEWQDRDRNDSYLLRGLDLENATQWLLQKSNKKPQPTSLHHDYINASRAIAVAQVKARQRARWIVIGTTLLANLLFTGAGFYWFYRYSTDRALWRIQQDMEQTLDGAIAEINGDEFAQLTQIQLPPEQTEPLDNPLYQAHQDWLRRINRIVPDAIPYSYTTDNQSGEIRFIGDVYRVVRPDYAYGFGQISPADATNKFYVQALSELVVSTDIVTDERGSWVFIAGPIKNSAGQSVGALVIDFKANFVTDMQSDVAQATGLACLIALLWLSFSSAIILKATASQAITPGKSSPDYLQAESKSGDRH